jgi:GNAT superfamily N-acetyltransferase
MSTEYPAVILRRASIDDAGAVATIWYDAWQDAHLGRVPAELAAARTEESFGTRAVERVGDTVVAIVDGAVAGFVMVVDDEVEQVYVAAHHRGAGVAGRLLGAAERVVADNGHRQAWLAVVAGNTRARRFYERQGWNDDGPFEYLAASAGGDIAVPCHRYTKRVARGRAAPSSL